MTYFFIFIIFKKIRFKDTNIFLIYMGKNFKNRIKL